MHRKRSRPLVIAFGRFPMHLFVRSGVLLMSRWQISRICQPRCREQSLHSELRDKEPLPFSDLVLPSASRQSRRFPTIAL